MFKSCVHYKYGPVREKYPSLCRQNYDVITTLNGGTEIEVLSVSENGWANIITVDRGIEGWMAERLLTEKLN